jgi:hypothetical protein
MDASATHENLEKLIDESGLSRLTERSVQSLRRDRMLGRGCPYIKMGRLVRYDPRDVREYLERCKRNSLGESPRSAT